MKQRLRVFLIATFVLVGSTLSGCDDPISYQGYQAPEYVPAIIPQYVTVDIRVSEQLTEAPSTKSEHKWQFEFTNAELGADTANGESLISLLLHMQGAEISEPLSTFVQLQRLQFEMDKLAVFERSSLMANSVIDEHSPQITLQLQERWPVTDGPVVSFGDEVALTLKHHTPENVAEGTEAPDHLAMSFVIPHSKLSGSNPALTYEITGEIRLYY